MSELEKAKLDHSLAKAASPPLEMKTALVENIVGLVDKKT